MKFIFVNTGTGEDFLVKMEKTRGVYEMKVYPVPGAEGEYSAVTLYEGMILPVRLYALRRPCEMLLLVLECEGEFEALPVKGSPEFFDLDEESARRFSEDHGVKLIT